MGGWWRWALLSPDGVAPSRMVGVSASVNLPLHHKVQKFSSGTGSPGWSQKKGRKTVVVWCTVEPVVQLCSDEPRFGSEVVAIKFTTKSHQRHSPIRDSGTTTPGPKYNITAIHSDTHLMTSIPEQPLGKPAPERLNYSGF